MVNTTRDVDFVEDWLLTISTPVPPFCVDLVLKNGHTYLLHSVSSINKETKSMVIRIWDLREFTQQDQEELKAKLNTIKSSDELREEQTIHPKLHWANLRINLSEISCCIEWHDRIWPEYVSRTIGFKK